jgi:formate dehydrogenase maturation protein FdhE
MASNLLDPVLRAGRGKTIWAAYCERAKKLNSEATNPLLARYIELVSLQVRLASTLVETLAIPHTDNNRSLLSYFSPEPLCPLLDMAAQEVAPNETSETAGQSLARLEVLWYQSEELHYPHDFAARLVLEVYATELAALPHKEIETTPDRCPHCGFPILCSVALEEGMGRRRSAVCSICSSEWPVPRLGCLRCGEQRASKLPVFSFDAWTHIRVEVCDSCGGYLKSIDRTKDAEALPVPDDVGSSAINIWAFDEGYQAIGRHFFNL